MTDLRCALILHAKAYGNAIEVRCFACGRHQSTDAGRVAVYHTWRLVDGQWTMLADRVESRPGLGKTLQSGRPLMVK